MKVLHPCVSQHICYSNTINTFVFCLFVCNFTACVFHSLPLENYCMLQKHCDTHTHARTHIYIQTLLHIPHFYRASEKVNFYSLKPENE